MLVLSGECWTFWFVLPSKWSGNSYSPIKALPTVFDCTYTSLSGVRCSLLLFWLAHILAWYILLRLQLACSLQVCLVLLWVEMTVCKNLFSMYFIASSIREQFGAEIILQQSREQFNHKYVALRAVDIISNNRKTFFSGSPFVHWLCLSVGQQ